MNKSLLAVILSLFLSIPLIAQANDFPDLDNRKDFIDVFFAVIQGQEEVEVDGKMYDIEYSKGNSSKDIRIKIAQAFSSLGTINFKKYDRKSFEGLLDTLHNVLTDNMGWRDYWNLWSIIYETDLSEDQAKELKDKNRQKSIWDIISSKTDDLPKEAVKSFKEFTGFKKFSYLTKLKSKDDHRQGYHVEIYNASEKVMALEKIEIFLVKHKKKDKKK